jgi:tetratricopeptide (TPR) repeat protein
VLKASLRVLLVAAAIGASYYSALLARAAYLFEGNTAASVGAAARLVPYNSRYVARLGAWESDRRWAQFHRAIELNPFDSESWIQLGLLTELDRQDPQAAERYYLKAAAVDHMFLPKWTLTNFYFRRQNEHQFFEWANATLKITPYAADPVFAQMWQMTRDAGQIGAAVPQRPRVLLQYAGFLSNSKRFASISPVVQRLVNSVPARDAHAWGRDDLLAGIEDRLLTAGELDAALKVWTSMKRAGWIRATIPDSEHPLTSGDFSFPSYGHGFDWTMADVAGVTIDQLTDLRSLRISLSGEQPERCELLRQYIPVEPGREYELLWVAKAPQITLPSGFAWHVRKAGESACSICSSMVSGDLLDATEGGWHFRAPAGANLCTLILEYARPFGAVRGAGSINLESVSLTRQP